MEEKDAWKNSTRDVERELEILEKKEVRKRERGERVRGGEESRGKPPDYRVKNDACRGRTNSRKRGKTKEEVKKEADEAGKEVMSEYKVLAGTQGKKELAKLEKKCESSKNEEKRKEENKEKSEYKAEETLRKKELAKLEKM